MPVPLRAEKDEPMKIITYKLRIALPNTGTHYATTACYAAFSMLSCNSASVFLRLFWWNILNCCVLNSNQNASPKLESGVQ